MRGKSRGRTKDRQQTYVSDECFVIGHVATDTYVRHMLAAILLFCVVAYAVRVTFFVVGFTRSGRRSPTTPIVPFVSVIVPARNEVATIERCLASLAASSYPVDRYEVIVVNDRSTDGTGDLLDTLATRFPNLVVRHRTQQDVTSNLKGKPGALQFGIDAARGSLLLFTDADCAVAPTWIGSMVEPFGDAAVGVVCATTSVRTTSAASAIQDVEWTYSQAMARGGVNNGIVLGCFGNNMAIRRDTYEALGGYASITFSVTEDLALLQAATDAGWQAVYRCDAASNVVTLPAATMSEYVRQRQRWGRGGLALGGRAALFVVSSLALWIGLLLACISGNGLAVAGLIACRMIGDATLITWALARLRRYGTIPWVLPSVVVLLLVELMLPIVVLRKDVVWKGQVFRST